MSLNTHSEPVPWPQGRNSEPVRILCLNSIDSKSTSTVSALENSILANCLEGSLHLCCCLWLIVKCVAVLQRCIIIELQRQGSSSLVMHLVGYGEHPVIVWTVKMVTYITYIGYCNEFVHAKHYIRENVWSDCKLKRGPKPNVSKCLFCSTLYLVRRSTECVRAQMVVAVSAWNHGNLSKQLSVKEQLRFRI